MSRKNKILAAVLLLTLSALIIEYKPHLRGLLNGVDIINNDSIDRQLMKIYDVNFAMDKVPIGSLPCYTPRYQPADSYTLQLYSGLFGMNVQNGEDDEAFYVSDDEGILIIYKHINRLHYQSKSQALSISQMTQIPSDNIPIDSENHSKSEAITSEKAIERALSFLNSKLLYISYEETEVSCDNDSYEVRFVNRLGNIRNYAFNNRVSMDKWGNISDMDYYYVTYEKLGTSRVMPMKDAFWSLPTDLPHGSVDLQNCRLVYFYENSIVQPGYLFEGEFTEDGQTIKSFQSYVKASVYT